MNYMPMQRLIKSDSWKLVGVGVIVMVFGLLMQPTIQTYLIPGRLKTMKQEVLTLFQNDTVSAENFWQLRDSVGIAWYHPNATYALENKEVASVLYQSRIFDGADIISTSPAQVELDELSQYISTDFSFKEAEAVNGFAAGLEELDENYLWVSYLYEK